MIPKRLQCSNCDNNYIFKSNGLNTNNFYECFQCHHRIENSSGAYVCEKCSSGICKLCYFGLSAHCSFCKKTFENCNEKIENVKYKKFFCSICFKERFLKNGFYQCSNCDFFKICLNCRSIMTYEKKTCTLPKSIMLYEYQKINENTNEWEEFKEGFFLNNFFFI